MHALSHSHRSRRLRGRPAFTLIEVSLVIGLMLGLVAFVGMNISSVRTWQKGKDAALSLEAVFAAQRAYMSDHPTGNIAGVSSTTLLPYMPDGWSTIPAVTSLDDDILAVDHSVMPPRLLLGSTVYDPSGAGNDGLWDTGK